MKSIAFILQCGYEICTQNGLKKRVEVPNPSGAKVTIYNSMRTKSISWRLMTRLPEKDIKHFSHFHYIDVIMTTMASQITTLMAVYSTVYSDADQRKHQSSASLAFLCVCGGGGGGGGIHRSIPRTKGQLRGKGFHLMTWSWILRNYRSCNCTQMFSCLHKYTVRGWLTSELR